MQVVPIKPTLKAPGTKRLKLKYDEALSNFAFKFNLRRYIKGNTNRSVKIGCKCSFTINVLAAHPDVAEVVLSPFAHTAECGVMRGGLSKSILAGRTLVHCQAITSSSYPRLVGLLRRCSS